MKVKGKTVEPPKAHFVPIPREEDDIIFECRPVMDYEEFDKICPMPKPPVEVKVATGERTEDYNDAEYLRAVDVYGTNKTNWLILQSLEGSVEWETVDLQDPATWVNFREEMKSVFLTREVDLIIEGVFHANLPTEERQKEALDRFMSSQAEGVDGNHTSQKEEQPSTPSGELVKD